MTIVDLARRRFLWVSVLVVAVAAAVSCAKSGGNSGNQGVGGDDGPAVGLPSGSDGSGVPSISLGDDGATSATPPPAVLANLVGLSVSPAMATLTYAYGSSTGAQQQYTAKGTFADGTTMDVTANVGWAVSPAGAAPAGGLFTAFTPGQFTITATGDNGTGMPITATATATVKVTGSVVAPGVGPSVQPGLDAPTAGTGPKIVYPLDGALFPANFAPLDFQVVASAPTQTMGRLAFEGDLIDLKVYAPCTPIANATLANACRLTIPSDVDSALQATLIGASLADNLTQTVRLAAQDGSGVAESASISVRWASDKLHGGLYYWAAAPNSSSTNMIKQVNLDQPGPAPVVYYTNADTQPLPGGQYYQPCFGCHAISYDGSKIALTFGGSIPSQFALLDAQSKTPLADDAGNVSVRLVEDGGANAPPFATRTTFSPDGTLMVQLLGGKLLVRSADATLATLGQPLFTDLPGATGELVTSPFWSPKGDLITFASWVGQASACTATSLSGSCTGDLIQNAQLWIAPVTLATAPGALPTFGTPMLLVPRNTDKTEYYPALSDDSKFVIFDESSCDGPSTPGSDNWGGGPCDSYDDPSATLRLVSATGGSPVYLANASNVNDPTVSATQQTWSNSWPRFSPPDPNTHEHGTFLGKTLYWIAFSSRRPYGAIVAGTNTPAMVDTTPQLWFAAVAIDPTGSLSSDPSYAPIWLPQQNDAELPDGGTADSGGVPRGNHLPQWVTKAVPVLSEVPQ